jgi:amidohydrolase
MSTPAVPTLDRERLVADRRDLHQHPELGFQETRTAGIVSERLAGYGYDVRGEVGKTGVVARRGREGGRCVLLRADMDGLPVQEANDVPYRSRHPGRMHACGHDGHVAIGLETARRLADLALPGQVKFAFQPAEEINDGALAMIEDGVLDAPTVNAAFGLHLWNNLPVGEIGIAAGPVMAAVDIFEIRIVGRGGHAGHPHQTIDPIVIAAQLTGAFQTIVSRRRDPFEEGLISVTHVRAGDAYNVIPDSAFLRGTARSYGGRFYEEAPQLIERTARGICETFGAACELDYRRLSGPVVNDGTMAELMRAAAQEVVGTSGVRGGVRSMGGEDMAYFLAAVPGCFAFVGSAPRGRPPSPHHSPTFDLDEEALAIGTDLLTRTALRYLAG